LKAVEKSGKVVFWKKREMWGYSTASLAIKKDTAHGYN